MTVIDHRAPERSSGPDAARSESVLPEAVLPEVEVAEDAGATAPDDVVAEAVQLSDATIAALSTDERRTLAGRLLGLAPLDLQAEAVKVRRHRLMVLLIASSVVMIPWIAFLAMSLPHRYVASNWPVTWVGFDIILLAALATTAYLGWRGRQLVTLASFATGILLICDAWFDISTSSGGDRLTSVLSAVLIELPLAALLMRLTYRMMRMVLAQRLGGADAQTLWRLPVLLDVPVVVGEVERLEHAYRDACRESHRTADPTGADRLTAL